MRHVHDEYPLREGVGDSTGLKLFNVRESAHTAKNEADNQVNRETDVVEQLVSLFGPESLFALNRFVDVKI